MTSLAVNLEDLPTQIGHLIGLVSSLENRLTQQQDEIQHLRLQVGRLEAELSTLHNFAPYILGKTGLNIDYTSTTPPATPQKILVQNPVIPLPSSSNVSAPTVLAPISSPRLPYSNAPPSPLTSSFSQIGKLSRASSTETIGRLDDMPLSDMKQALETLETISHFRTLMNDYELPYLVLCEKDKDRLEQTKRVHEIKQEIESLRDALIAAHNQHGSTPLITAYSSSAPYTHASANISQPPFTLGPRSPSTITTGKIGLIASPRTSADSLQVPKPHPFGVSSSSPSITSSTATNTPLSKVPSSALSSRGNIRSSGSSTSSQYDADDDAVLGEINFMNELDYQSLVEATPGKPWPKLLNDKKTASLEEAKATERFKAECAELKVKLIKPDDLIFTSLLGRGSSANVYQGVFTDSDNSGHCQEVAVKILNTSPADLRSLMKAHKETADELLVVQKVQSPHVVRLFGITVEPSLCIVLEFCQRGSLYDVLCSDIQLSWRQTLTWFIQITKGVLALHSSDPPIVHRDLKSLNLLVDEDMNIKVADFGLSRLSEGTPQQLSTLSKLRGTYVYCAPEIYFGDPFTPLADVYSLAIIFWELVARCISGDYQRPFSEFSSVSYGFQVVIMASRKGIRPTIPPSPPIIQDLITTLWNANPKKRPNCVQLLERLKKVEEEYEKNSEAWDSGTCFAPALKDVQVPPPELLLPRKPSVAANLGSSQPPTGSASPPIAKKSSAPPSDIVPPLSSKKVREKSLKSLKGILTTPKEKRRGSEKRKPVFEDLLTDSRLFKSFESHLTKERSNEYLSFWKEVSEFERKAPGASDLLSTAKKIATSYLDQVCGQPRERDIIEQKIADANPDVGMFVGVRNEVESILKTKFVSFTNLVYSVN